MEKDKIIIQDYLINLKDKIESGNPEGFSEELKNMRKWINSKNDKERKWIIENVLPEVKSLMERLQESMSILEEVSIDSARKYQTNKLYNKY